MNELQDVLHAGLLHAGFYEVLDGFDVVVGRPLGGLDLLGVRLAEVVDHLVEVVELFGAEAL